MIAFLKKARSVRALAAQIVICRIADVESTGCCMVAGASVCGQPEEAVPIDNEVNHG